MNNTPILFYKDGRWYKKCAVCPNFISHRYKSQIRQNTCSHSCQLKGNQLRKGLKPTNAFTSEQMKGNKNRLGLVPDNAFKPDDLVDEKHPNWKGDSVGYNALHSWIGRKLGNSKRCENCDTIDHQFYEWANISGEYRRDLSDWVRLCKMCHILIDNSSRGRNPTGRRWQLR